MSDTERKRNLAGGPGSGEPSFGEELRRERELRGISLREIAESTKINLRYLQALERNEFEALPGGIFTKGFVKAYAQFIGLDPETTVNAYLLEQRSRRNETESADEDPQALLRGLAREPTPPAPATGPGRKRARVWGLIALALVVAVVAVVVSIVVLRSHGDPDVTADEPTAEVTDPADTADAARPAATESGDTGEGEAAAPPAVPPMLPSRDEAPRVEIEKEPAPSRREAERGEIIARVVLDRTTSGRLDCDNQRVEVLDGLPAGTVLELTCQKYLELDATDGGSVRVGIGGAAPTALGTDGVPLTKYRILPGSETRKGRGASS